MSSHLSLTYFPPYKGTSDTKTNPNETSLHILYVGKVIKVSVW